MKLTLDKVLATKTVRRFWRSLPFGFRPYTPMNSSMPFQIGNHSSARHCVFPRLTEELIFITFLHFTAFHRFVDCWVDCN